MTRAFFLVLPVSQPAHHRLEVDVAAEHSEIYFHAIEAASLLFGRFPRPFQPRSIFLFCHVHCTPALTCSHLHRDGLEVRREKGKFEAKSSNLLERLLTPAGE